MQVKLIDVEADLGYKGVVLYVADNKGSHQGKIRIGSATVEWCKGKTRMGNGKKIKMADFLAALDEM
jgi:hypothetical protein